MKGVRNSDDLNRLLAGEVNTSQLAQLFEISVATVRSKLLPVRPVRDDGRGAVVYRFRDVAPYLARLPNDVVSQVMRLNHMDLPPMLRKEFWTGQAQMLKVRQAEGELFAVDAVLSYVSELIKTFRMGVLLMSDAVERETVFTPRQREALSILQDELLETVRADAQRLFGEKFDDPAGLPGIAGLRAFDDEGEPTLEEQAADL
jgi:hypothetical protein